MNLDLKSEKINYMKPVFSHRFTREETLEVIVPDALPDILRIFETDGTPLLRSKDADVGRVSVAGVVEGEVIYIPENSGEITRLDINIPFSASADSGDILPESLITAKVVLISAESKMLNPRKILVKIELLFDVSCYLPKEIFVSEEAEYDDIFQRFESAEVKLPASVTEKTFIFTDALRLPSDQQPISDVLKTSVELKCDEVKPVGNKAVIRGTAFTRMAYTSRDNGKINECSFESPFSQVVEMDTSGEADSFDIQLMLTGTYISRDYMDDSGNESMSLEVHAVAQCVSYSVYNISYLADAYSTKYQLDLGVEQEEYTGRIRAERLSSSVKGSVQLPSASAEVQFASAHTGAVTCSNLSNKSVISSSIIVTIIYADQDGSISSVVKRLEFQQEFDIQANEMLHADLEIAGDVFTSLTDNQVEIRVPLDIIITCSSSLTIERVSSITYDEERIIDLSSIPSIVVVRLGEKFDFWELSKRYLSSQEAILKANGFESSTDLKPGCVLLIPRKK